MGGWGRNLAIPAFYVFPLAVVSIPREKSSIFCLEYITLAAKILGNEGTEIL